MLTTKEKNITWSSSADTKKVLKFNSFLIKILNNLEIKRKVLHEIKHIYKKPIANITFHVERQCFPYKTGNRQNVSSHHTVQEILDNAIRLKRRQEDKKKDHTIEK